MQPIRISKKCRLLFEVDYYFYNLLGFYINVDYYLRSTIIYATYLDFKEMSTIILGHTVGVF